MGRNPRRFRQKMKFYHNHFYTPPSYDNHYKFNWIYRINFAIKSIGQSNKKIKVLVFLAITFAIIYLIPQYSYLIALAAIIIFKFLNFIPPKLKKTIKLLNQAKFEFNNNNISKTFDLLNKAYQLSQNYELKKLIHDFANYYNLNNNLEIQELENKINSINDEDLKQILKYQLDILKLILKHKQNLNNIKNKISSLNNELNKTPEQLKPKLLNLINQYKSLEQLENAKIEFFSKNSEQLTQLYDLFYYNKKIDQEQKKLSNLKQQILEDSISEQYTIDDQTHNINYLKIYFQTLNDYTEKIENSESSEIFDKLTKEFQQKTQNLFNNKQN